MTIEEIKLRRITNQHIVTPSDTITVVRDLCGIQAQFMSNVMHSLKIRTCDFDEKTIGDGLVKNWTIRGTVHVFSEEDVPLFVRCSDGKNYRKNEWSQKSFWNQREKWSLTPERQAYFSDVIVGSLRERSMTRDELKDICLRNGMTKAEEDSMFDSWGGGIREICERGFVCGVVSEEKAYRLMPEYIPMSDKDAELEIARRYFTNFGPVTIHDAMYFFHESAAKIKSRMEKLPLICAECDGKTYFYIENGKVYDADVPRCIFLAGFDQLMLGYEKKESLFLKQEHLRGIFNLAGIVTPSVLLDGQVVGKWKKKNRSLTVELFEAIGTERERIIKEKAEETWEDLAGIEILS